jgi:hypothetical protein
MPTHQHPPRTAKVGACHHRIVDADDLKVRVLTQRLLNARGNVSFAM